MSVTISTSISDSLDRLSILDVKLLKIHNQEKIKEINKEKKIIEEQVINYKNKVEFYYSILVEINEKIWDLLDKAKYNSSNENEELKNYRAQEDYNERRHRVKKKIDNYLSSNIKEQKGYKLKKAFVLGHLGLGDQFDDVGIVRYLSTKYDKVYVVAKTKSSENIKKLYLDDKSIKIFNTEDDRFLSPAYGACRDKFKKIVKNCDVYTIGFHKHGIHIKYPSDKMYDLPVSFYHDTNVPFYAFWKYFYIPTYESSKILYNLINDCAESYIFIHNTSSIGKIFNIEDIEKKFNLNKDKTLFINPCVNLYNENHKFYEIAQQFVFKDFVDYITTIENASKVILTDSSFCSLAIHLDIKTDERYIVYRRGNSYNYSYNHLWENPKYKYKKSKPFKQLFL